MQPGVDLEGFRAALRGLMAAAVPPQAVFWETQDSLFAQTPADEAPPVGLPRGVGEIIRLVTCHSDPERYALLYQLVWRIRYGEPHLPQVASDPLIHRLHRMERSVRRDLHKMHAFVRFRRLELDGDEQFIAWFEPEHHIIAATAQFFVDRFTSMRWSILTPKGSLHWDRENLLFGPPAAKGDAPQGDGFEAGWRAYYESIFNPARLNPGVMRSHMAKKYWKNLPEAASIRELLRSAPSRVRQMVEQEQSMPRKRNPQKAVAAMADDVPQSLEALNRIIAASPAMVPGGIRAVLGEGPLHPSIAFVGEQPGDQEDLQGKPFVGPAGQVLDRALAEVGIARRETYITNAVKHFKFELRGKRRLHAKPNAGEVKHYRWWLEKELDFVKPKLVVALGATAVLALTGKALPINANRGPADLGGRPGVITVHPSYLLRLMEGQEQAYRAFVNDLKTAKALSENREAA